MTRTIMMMMMSTIESNTIKAMVLGEEAQERDLVEAMLHSQIRTCRGTMEAGPQQRDHLTSRYLSNPSLQFTLILSL